MSTRQHATLEDARISQLEVRRAQEVDSDLSAESILGSFRRELKFADIEGLGRDGRSGRVWYYHPQSVAEKDAYHKHIRYSEEGVKISMGAMIDGIIARVRNDKGAPMFTAQHREKLLQMDASLLQRIWNALGAEVAEPLSVADAEKK